MRALPVQSVKQQRGISLIELMVAITLSLILGTALIQIFSSSRGSYRQQEAASRLQENGRYTIEMLAQDVRMAGYMGCASIDNIPVTIKASGPLPSDVMFDATQIIRGLNNVAAVNPYNAELGTDVLIIRRASDTGVRLTGNMTADNANIQMVDNSAGFVAGDFLFITDCASADLFCANNVSSGGTVTISHSSSCNIDPKLSKAYKTDAEVLAFRSSAYFIRATGRTTSAGNPILALWGVSRGVGSTAALTAYELIEGVQNMQLEYGVDTNLDRAADEYKTANNIANADWANVTTVRVNLLLQSVDEGLVGSSGATAQRLDFNGGPVTADGRLRQVFSTVIAIRNRLP